MLVSVESTDKFDNSTFEVDCSDEDFRSPEALLYQVLHRTTAKVASYEARRQLRTRKLPGFALVLSQQDGSSERLLLCICRGSCSPGSMNYMLWKRQPTRANRKLATISTSNPDEPPLPTTACVRTSVLQAAKTAEKMRSVTLPPAVPQKKNRCSFSCDAADEMLTCFVSS